MAYFANLILQLCRKNSTPAACTTIPARTSEGPDKPTDLVTLITTLTEEWEHYHLQDDDLWESFRENFEGCIEDDFKIPTTTQIRKLRELLRKQGVWVLKNPKVSVAKSLFNILQEEIPTPWTEEEITKCKDKEVFTSCHVTHLIETDFGRKPKWTITTPIVAVPPTARSPKLYSSPPGLLSHTKPPSPPTHSTTLVEGRQPANFQGQQPGMQSFQQCPFQYLPTPQRPLPQQSFRQNQGQWSEHSAHEISQQSFRQNRSQRSKHSESAYEIPQQPLPYSPLHHVSPYDESQRQPQQPPYNPPQPDPLSSQPCYNPPLLSFQPPAPLANSANVSSPLGWW